jgi:two-component sensor histidine kinase/DNA-binding response OmpR family regulator
MTEQVNILLVDDQPEKLLAYEVILGGLNENLVKAPSARDALTFLLKNDVAVVLIDVCMPELDGFQLAEMIREHPRFQKTAIIFISAIQVDDIDRLRGYELGAVDYVPVPVVPDLLRAKVRIFVDLYRKTRELEGLNVELERRVAERTAQIEASNAQLVQSEQGRSLALAAGQMGSWEWEVGSSELKWDEGQHRIFGVDPRRFAPNIESIQRLVHPEDWQALHQMIERMSENARTQQTEFRVVRPNGEMRWCTGSAAASVDAGGKVVRVSGVTIDITDRKEAEERQTLLAREVDHRARNALAVIQSIIRLTRARSVDDYVLAIEGRIRALARAHTLLSDSRWNGADLATLAAEELAPYRSGDKVGISGPDVSLEPSTAQGLALALHELATNAAKHGALSSINGKLDLTWQLGADALVLQWSESGGPPITPPTSRSFGLRVIRASIEQQLSGEATFDWDPKGLYCSFSIPRRDAMKVREFTTAPRLASVNGGGGLKVTGRPRVLLVEDEALVAMMVQECLADFGYQVIGPISTATEAAARAKDGNFEAAVLDINLGDGAVYPIADMLMARGVPFVFVTGYDAESVDARFRNVPVLQKPIERDMLQRIFVVAAKAAVAG